MGQIICGKNETQNTQTFMAESSSILYSIIEHGADTPHKPLHVLIRRY